MNRILTVLYLALGIAFFFVPETHALSLQDSVQVKSSKSKIDTLRLLSDQPLKSPWGAVLRSAILPGWGQVYNQKYIKAGVVFSVNAALMWKILDYNKQWEDTKNESFREKRSLYTWYFGLAYLLTLVDAYVDAALFGFDDAMDMACLPPTPDQSAWTLTIRLKF